MSAATTHFRATHPDERGPARPGRSALVRRNLIHIKRQPEMLTDVTIQPVIFVLLFAFVFGGSITIPGVDYKEWLLPGIMAQTMAFSAFIVAVGPYLGHHQGNHRTGWGRCPSVARLSWWPAAA